MVLPSWWQVATPHRDILKGKLNESIFAADLGDVAESNQNIPIEYRDASVFFQKTYLTTGLTKLLENVLSRLAGNDGDPVIQLQTPFGGGKTHSLLALYHCVKSRESVGHILPLSALPSPKAKVVVFVGTHADPLQGKTPWGELAHQLGQYSVLEEHDKKRIAPGKEKIRKVLSASGPTLILMDEILEYITKANRAEKVERITQGQTLAFLQELTEVVASTPNCCLVITLPASILEKYDEEAERSLKQLQKVIGRVEAIYTPVEGKEIYEVVRKRLFEDLGEDKVRRQVADWYFSLYQRIPNDVPPEVREVDYRDRMLRAYPFHPELIDILYERWGSYPTFQRTRGVLRLLAEVVGDLYQKKTVSPLIQSSIVGLDNQTIRREFIKHIGNEFDSVVSSDVAGQNAKAPKIDKEMGSEYSKYNISKGIATSIFIYSFSGGDTKGTTVQRIRVALLRENIPVTIVGDAVSRLEQELWFLHSENKQYVFRNQANLNRVIVDKEETITDDRVWEKLKELTQKIAGNGFGIYLWPEQTSDIPDNKALKLAILSPAYLGEKGKALAAELIGFTGSSFRAYKNTLFVLMADESHHDGMKKAVIRHLALTEVQKNPDLMGKLTKQSVSELKERVDDAQKGLNFGVLNAYRQIGFQGATGIEWKDMGMPTNDRQTLSERVRQKLVDDEKVLGNITPKYILDKTFSSIEKEKTIKDVYDLLLKTPGLSIPESESVVLGSVSKYVSEGKIGLRKGNEVLFKERTTPSLDDMVLRPEYAATLKSANVPHSEPPKNPEVPTLTEEGGTSTSPIPTREVSGIRKVSFRATVPYDKISELVMGVIYPLKAAGSQPIITIEMEASSETGFDRTTLDAKVKETLKQIGGKIEEWEEKQ